MRISKLEPRSEVYKITLTKEELTKLWHINHPNTRLVWSSRPTFETHWTTVDEFKIQIWIIINEVLLRP